MTTTPSVPRISILLPTYNRVGLLRRAVESILRQSFADWELLAVNDASTDGTKEYLDDLALRDARVRPVHNAKNNYPDISGSLNRSMALARGEYIGRLDDDDYWNDPEKLARQAAFLDAHPACVIVGGGTIVVDAEDRERFRYRKLEGDAEIRDKALFANPFTHSTVLFRRAVAEAVGGYGNFRNAEDWDLWLRMGMRGEFYNFPDYFVRYLMTEESKTFIFKRSQSKELLRIVWVHRRAYPHAFGALLIAFAQYGYSLLPLMFRRMLYHTLSRLKRGIFAARP